MSVGDDSFGIVVYEFEKNGREIIRIGLNEYQGHEYVDLRIYYEKEGSYLPSKKGVTMAKDLYPALLEGVIELGKALGYDEFFNDD
jgi:hypothetical protein